MESAVSDLKKAIESDDKDAIERKSKALAEASAGLAQKLYAEQQRAARKGLEKPSQSDDDVVDAEFEEVDDDNKSKRAYKLEYRLAKDGEQGRRSRRPAIEGHGKTRLLRNSRHFTDGIRRRHQESLSSACHEASSGPQQGR